MRKQFLSLCVCCIMLLGLLPAATYAEGAKVAPQAWIGETAYPTLEEAVNAAESGATITLGEGKYTLYSKGADTKGKDLTFIGQGADKTAWGIGATVPDPDKFGTEYNGDYSFDGAGTITFKEMTLQSGAVDYLGFIRADNTIVENCTINGKTFYWGYTSATFKNTTFNAPDGDYAIWTYCSPTMTFDGCTFNSSGKTINVYTDYSAGTQDITVNYIGCTVYGNTPEGKKDKAVMNINDSNMGDYKYIINISGTNVVNGVTPDDLNKEYTKAQGDITCSKLFEFNTKYGKGNSGRTVVSIDGTTVWENGTMVSHAIDTENDKYTDGYKDNAFDATTGEWTKNADGTYSRIYSKVCRYCGYAERGTETGFAVTYDLNGGTGDAAADYSEQIVAEGSSITVNHAPTRSGYVFAGWSDGTNTLQPGASLTPKNNVTLTAQWTAESTPVTPAEPITRPPQTGDASSLLLAVSLILGSCSISAGVAAFRKKEH